MRVAVARMHVESTERRVRTKVTAKICFEVKKSDEIMRKRNVIYIIGNCGSSVAKATIGN